MLTFDLRRVTQLQHVSGEIAPVHFCPCLIFGASAEPHDSLRHHSLLPWMLHGHAALLSPMLLSATEHCYVCLLAAVCCLHEQ